MKSKKGKATDHTKAETIDNGNDVKDATSEAESAVSEDAKVSSQPKNKRGKRRGNNTGLEDGGTETKKMRNVGAEEETEDVKYEVESIEDTRQKNGKTQFRIRWKGYGPDRDTWENEEDLSCPNIIKAFLEKNKNESKAKKRAGKAADSSFSRKSKNEAEEGNVEDEEEGESKEYEVDKVMEVHFKKNGSREFLIHWKGFSHKDDTWEPEKNLSCPELIEKFMAKVDKAKSAAARELRVNPQHTDRFTLNVSQAGRRLSRRNQGKQRATYHGYM